MGGSGGGGGVDPAQYCESPMYAQRTKNCGMIDQPNDDENKGNKSY